MADVTPVVPAGRQVIQAYGEGRFRVSGVIREGSIVVLPQETFAWDVGSFSELALPSFAPIVERADAIDVLLLGCGSRMQLVPRALREALRAEGIVVDAMDTGAACRTYNVLMAEDRLVAAALIAV